MQLKPSMKREIRGCAVEVNMACCVVEGSWTWSKEKTCFFDAALDDAAGAGDDELALGGALDVPSTETELGEVV